MDELPEHLRNATTDEKMDWVFAQAEARVLTWARAYNAAWTKEVLEGKPGGVSEFLKGIL